MLRKVVAAALLACTYSGFSQTKNFVVKTDKVGVAIQPTMWGVFF
jgi:hypothetical protein